MARAGDRPTTNERRDALRAWQYGLAKGHPGLDLTFEDLEAIANSSVVDAAMIKRIPLVSSTSLLHELADELSDVLEPTRPQAQRGHRRQQSQPVSDPLRTLQFAPRDLRHDLGSDRVVSIQHELAGGGIRLTWPEVTTKSGTVIYRLVSTDADASPAPEYGDLVDVTHARTATDGRPFTHVRRHYQVWVNTGKDDRAAAASQPSLHARATVVAPVQQCDILVDEGVVVGRWSAVPGTTRVAVHRSAPGAKFSPAHELRGDHPAGFTDTSGRPGQTYAYSVYAMCTVDGVELQSVPVSKTVTIPAKLEPVDDLHVRVYVVAGQTLFDLEWTAPPDGEVHIYRTAHEPNPGLQGERRGLDAIEREGLDGDAQVKYPAYVDGGRARIEGVPWPSEWPRAHFTPVTVSGDQGRVGPSVTSVRAEPLRDAILVERVDYQMAVFDWPAGAASVAAYVTPQGAPLFEPLAHHPYGEISRHDYERLGGLALRLPGDPLDVHLVPKAWDRGRPVLGDPQALEYPGLLRIGYLLRPLPAEPNRGILRRRDSGPESAHTHMLVLVADRDLPYTPRLGLFHNGRRLPLSPYDEVTFVAEIPQRSLQAGIYTDACLLDLGAVQGGFVRLFVTHSDVQVTIAVLDPDIETLRR